MGLMLKKIFRAVSLLFLPLILLSSILFTGLASADAVLKGYTPPEEESSPVGANGDLKREKSKEEINLDELLGPEQVFPFEPGLGNQSGAISGITGAY